MRLLCDTYRYGRAHGYIPWGSRALLAAVFTIFCVGAAGLSRWWVGLLASLLYWTLFFYGIWDEMAEMRRRRAEEVTA